MKLPRKVLCLDWDTRALRLVVARPRGGQITLEDAHSHRLPNTVDPENPQALGEFIHQMLRRHHWSFSRVVVDIPREKAVINRLTVPPTPPHEVAAAVRFQAMKELPFPLDGAVVDFVIMKRDERGWTTEVLLAAVPVDALNVVRATCEAAGLEPTYVGLRPYANLVSVAQLPGLAEQRVLFVGVGPTMTEIDIMIGGQLAFARSANVGVPVSPDVVTDDSRIASTDAADLQFTDAAVEAAVRDITVEMTRTLQAYRAADPDVTIDRIVIAGGTGSEVALLGAVEERFGAPGLLFDPTRVLGVRADEAAKLRSFSATLGLAWGLSRDGALAIDFANPKKPIPPRAALKRRLRIGAIAAGVVLAVALGIDVTLYLRQSGEYARHQKSIADLKKKLADHVQIENRVEEVEDWQTEAVWAEHLLLLTESAVEPGKDMLVQQMALDARTATINLKKVMATGWHVPTDFVTKLNELTADGKRLYRAALGGWRTLSGRNPKFQGTVDIDVEVLSLKKHLEERELREKARRGKLRGL